MLIAEYYPRLYKCVCYVQGRKIWEITVKSLQEAYRIKTDNEKENVHHYPIPVSVTILCIQKIKEVKEA